MGRKQDLLDFTTWRYIGTERKRADGKLIRINRLRKSGHSSAVEYELPKLGVAGSNPVVRSFSII